MKKLAATLVLSAMVAAMAVPAFAAEAAPSPRAGGEITALASRNSSSATGTGRGSKRMTSITVYMDVEVGGKGLPTVTASSKNSTYATARKSAQNITKVYVEAYGNDNGYTTYDTAQA